MMERLSSLCIVMLATTSFGCAMSASENRRLAEDLQRAQLRTLEGQVRLAELERRLVQMEQAARADAAKASERGGLGDKLDLLIAQNQLLLAQRPELASVQSQRVASSPDAACDADGDADPREQLRFWAERVREDTTRWRGGLSTAQSEALNVLLRPRSLDPSNPW
jgi:hypothetical protein